ncbi:RNA polymerase sigma factor [Butyrivibrio sp. AE3004]|uniref:RNA polymerase sigma factor n=1 Tax=Butyrivibrio sp. AE3004 TaxID=1506994 RepID=UPI001FA74FF0|nr:sigma-70 family RNA polymerase sigma factor [Butyrivibrio sp. AE3004]
MYNLALYGENELNENCLTYVWSYGALVREFWKKLIIRFENRMEGWCFSYKAMKGLFKESLLYEILSAEAFDKKEIRTNTSPQNEAGRLDYNPTVKAGELLDKYGNSILRCAYSYLHNMSDAEDILQDTLIQYMKKVPVFENDHHEKAWLLTVAANLSKNKIEYLGIRRADELSEELVAENKEDLAFVWDAVKQLPEKFREVIHLFYEEGYSTKEIAEILKRNESTVRSDLNRGRQQLKTILKEVYDFE